MAKRWWGAICKVCGNEFDHETLAAKYCSGACRQKAYRERLKSYASNRNA